MIWISPCLVSFPKCLAAPAPSSVIWNPTFSTDYFLTKWITLFRLSLLPYCLNCPISYLHITSKWKDSWGQVVDQFSCSQGASLGQYLSLYSFLCLQNSASDFPPLPSALVTVLWLHMPRSQVRISSYTSWQTTEVTWERELTLYFTSQKCSRMLGGKAENGEWLNSYCFPVKAIQQTSVLPVPVV